MITTLINIKNIKHWLITGVCYGARVDDIDRINYINFVALGLGNLHISVNAFVECANQRKIQIKLEHISKSNNNLDIHIVPVKPIFDELVYAVEDSSMGCDIKCRVILKDIDF